MAKYVGPKTDPDNVATQSDLAGASGGVEVSATAPESPSEGDFWYDSEAGEMFIYYDSQWVAPVVPATVPTASASTITGSNSEGSSNSFARADHDHSYGAGSIPQSALALGPTYETSLPGSPVDGQEIYYAADASNGVIWHLRYRSGASGSYKWEYVGGGNLSDYISTDQTKASSSYADLATVGPSITAPLAGEYHITFSATVFNESNASSTGARVKLSISGSVLADSEPFIEHLAAVAFDLDSVGKETVQTVSGTRVVKLVYSNRTGSGTAHFFQRFLSIRPVRVG